MVARYPGFTPEGASAPAGSGNVIGADRVNRNYAVYVNLRGEKYIAPAGKPKSPLDKVVASNLTLQEAEQQTSGAAQVRAMGNRAAGAVGGGWIEALDKVKQSKNSGSVGNAVGAATGSVGQTVNNTSQAVSDVVAQQGQRDMESQSQADLGASANLDDTWLAGRNQGAVQAVMNGSQVADPRQALNWMLESQGLDTHANRGFLEQAMANYNPLFQIMNAGKPGLDPEYALLGAGNFANNLMGMSGNSMNRVDTQGIYDNIWSDAFRNFNSEQVDQTSGGPQAAYQRIIDSISALAPYMGQQNADYLLTKINTAYEDFLNRSTKGDGMQGEQDFLNFIMQFNPQDWY